MPVALKHREQHIDFFRHLDWPYVGLCAEVDVSQFLQNCHTSEISSYLGLVHIIMGICHDTPWLRCRIKGSEIISHTHLHAGITIKGMDQQVRFLWLPWQSDRHAFFLQARRAIEETKTSTTLFNGGMTEQNQDDVVYLSCLPWLRFTSICQPVPIKQPDSIPRIVWGKYTHSGDTITMPLAIQTHHALADGFHLCEFYRVVQNRIDGSHH